MNLELDKHITDLKNTIKTWQIFLAQLQELDNDDIIEHGADGYKMVWTSQQIDFYFDHSTLDAISRYVAKKAGIITDVRFNIPNYDVRKGIQNCEKYIKGEISSLEKSIKSLQELRSA